MSKKPDWSKYALADGDPKTATVFKVPQPFCGVYKHTSLFEEETLLIFRYIPRAAKHRGRHGVFADDPDAGSVLIGLYDPETEEIVREGKLYPQYWESWLGAILVEVRCAWCGRKIKGTDDTGGSGQIHFSCLKKSREPKKESEIY